MPIVQQSSRVDHSDSLYLVVEATDLNRSDVIVPNGAVWEITRFVGAASYLDDTSACLLWDPDGVNTVVSCTHGDANVSPQFSVTGDGVKVLRIELSNDTNTPRVMGCRWEAREV